MIFGVTALIPSFLYLCLNHKYIINAFVNSQDITSMTQTNRIKNKNIMAKLAYTIMEPKLYFLFISKFFSLSIWHNFKAEKQATFKRISLITNYTISYPYLNGRTINNAKRYITFNAHIVIIYSQGILFNITTIKATRHILNISTISQYAANLFL